MNPRRNIKRKIVVDKATQRDIRSWAYDLKESIKRRVNNVQQGETEDIPYEEVTPKQLPPEP